MKYIELLIIAIIFTASCSVNYDKNENKKRERSDLMIKQHVESLSNEDIKLKYSASDRVIPFFSKKAVKIYHMKDPRKIFYLRENLNDNNKFVAAHVLLTLLTQKSHWASAGAWEKIDIKTLRENPQKVQELIKKHWSSKRKLTIIQNRPLTCGFLE